MKTLRLTLTLAVRRAPQETDTLWGKAYAVARRLQRYVGHANPVTRLPKLPRFIYHTAVLDEMNRNSSWLSLAKGIEGPVITNT